MKNDPMDERFDWLGDAGENYARYCFACEGYEIFGAGKWAADSAIRDRSSKEWYRVEIKTTDRNRRPIIPPQNRLKGRVDYLVEIRFIGDSMESGKIVTFYMSKIDSAGRRIDRSEMKRVGDIRKFIENQS